MMETADDGRADAQRPSIDWPAELARHDRWLRTVIAARLREQSAVDEVQQEVRLAALAQRSPLRDSDRVAPWLYRLAVLQSLVYRRGRGRSRKLAASYAARAEQPAFQRETMDPLEWLLADERRRLVREALAELSRRDAEILLLKYTENWTYHEIAEHLGASHSAVEARLHRARGRLRERLAATSVIEAWR